MQEAVGKEPVLSIILTVIFERQVETLENLFCLSKVQTSLPQRPSAFRIVKFDFHIIIVYTIKRKSQASEPLHPTAIIR
jgi:hypothetical protein